VNVGLWLERFDEYLELRGFTGKTREGYGYALRQFLRFLGDRGLTDVSEISRGEIDAYRVHLHHCRTRSGRPLSLAAHTGRLSPVLSFLRYLHQERLILANPGFGVKLPRVPDKLPPPLPDEEQVLLLLEAPDVSTPTGLRDRAIVELLYSSAMRNAELRALDVEHLDLVRAEVRIECGKGQKGRLLPLSEPAAQWLETYLRDGRPWLAREAQTRALFLNTLGRRLSGELLTDLVRELAQKAKLPGKVTPHVLRHCCATHMLARKAGLRHLQQLLGHASADSTRRYTRIEISDLREEHRRCHPREA
jgi:integrase/recombinase XerD